jgi:hypothetical protein
MVLLDDDIKDFNISFLDREHKDFTNVTNDKYFEVLAQKRDESFFKKKQNQLEGIETRKELHLKSLNF